MKASSNANKVSTARDLAPVESRAATKELHQLNIESRRLLRAGDHAEFDALRERSNVARARVSAAMLAVVHAAEKEKT